MADQREKFRWHRVGSASWHTNQVFRGYSGVIDYVVGTGYTLTTTPSGAPTGPYTTLKNAKNAFRKFLHTKQSLFMKLNPFTRPDPDDALDEKLKNPEVTTPVDLETTEPLPTSVSTTGKTLQDYSDEELTVELARRKAAKLDPRIEALRRELEALEAEKAGYAGLVPTAETFKPTTLVNPITGRNNSKPPRPGTVPKGTCSCSGGCYLCMSR